MKWRYTFSVAAPAQSLYRVAAPARWMSFYLPRFYDGIEHVDETWPDAGATIVLRTASARSRF